MAVGYTWLPHRKSAEDPRPPFHPPADPSDTDSPRDVAKTVSGRPDLLILVDALNLHSLAAEGGYEAGIRAHANHMATGHKPQRPYLLPCGAGVSAAPDDRWGHDIPPIDPYNPDTFPQGANLARIDCRVTWKPWQDIDLGRWWPFAPASAASTTVRPWGHAW